MKSKPFGSKQKLASAIGFGCAPIGFPTYLNPEGISEERLTEAAYEAVGYAAENGIAV